MKDLDRLRKEHGIADWFYTKGQYHSSWELDIPRDNNDITSVWSVEQLNEIDLKRCDECSFKGETDEKDYQDWEDKTCRAIYKATKALSMRKRFVFYMLYVYRGESLDYKDFKSLICKCFVLHRDRKQILHRTIELFGSGDIRLNQQSLAYLLGVSRNTIGNDFKQIRAELESLKDKLKSLETYQYWRNN